MRKKVLVSGCFDLLHSGHVAFLQEAASLGLLHVCIGSDQTIHALKGRFPVNAQAERMFMLEALSCVHTVRVSRGSGMLDFEPELDAIRPDIFFVNEDGHTPEKEALCRAHGIEYTVAKRTPAGQLPARSTTALRQVSNIPYRIDLAGGWLDQPWVSIHYPGPVITISIEPTQQFNHRSGMATSTRDKAIELWGQALPSGNPEQLARILFAYDNPPGTVEVSGSQDSIGIIMPGLNKAHYTGRFWPERIEPVQEERILDWLERHLFLLPLGPRRAGYQVLDETRIEPENVRALALAAEACWEAILQQDLVAFGRAFRASFEAQIAMFPNMVDPEILALIEQFRDKTLGWKLSGAGGGGYLILIAENPVQDTIQIKIRRQKPD
ncbi:MAG: adenylyltransferase/cytidyltransferase family protein [Lewinellaceae bacterium]|nr:adenylyltransferase/cytidyltransferase family protein [Lewinellaceae bacterium]